jgi:DNA polymerase (family 10)
MDKKRIIEILEEIAALLELKNENPFKIRAYRNGARALLNMEEDLSKVIREKRLTDFEGIGDHLAIKITTLAKKGRLPYYEQLKKSVPPALLKLIEVQGLGPKKVQILHKKLRIESVPALKKAAKEGKLAKLKGFGKKTEENILDALTHHETYQKRHLWWDAYELSLPLLAGLKKLPGVKEAEIAGSVRRGLETIGDLDFVVAATDPKRVMEWFTKNPMVAKVLAKGETKSSVRLEGGMSADLRVVSPSEFSFALLYFTGSKEHTVKMRERAQKRGWSLSEYGIESKKRLPKMPTSEEEIFKLFGLSYIPPELRENRGEFEAAAKRKIPRLIEESDLRGCFHNHTTASDGRNTLKEMIAEGEELKWEYIGISDHSKAAFQANGLSEERLLKQAEEIRKLNEEKKFRIHVFAGLECDILANGTLDCSDRTLKKLDFVIASIHSSFQLDEKKMTARLIKAIEHPSTTMVGHVTGRLLLKREPYAVNLSKVIDACIANRKIMELNANPSRLDMDWRFWHSASERGLLCSINPDAHATDQLLYVRAGVNSARKGWLEKNQVINTLSLKEMKKLLSKMHP